MNRELRELREMEKTFFAWFAVQTVLLPKNAPAKRVHLDTAGIVGLAPSPAKVSAGALACRTAGEGARATNDRRGRLSHYPNSFKWHPG